MHDTTVVNGFKRIVGSFPEASTFAAISMPPLAFTFRLALLGVYPAVSRTLFLLTLILLVLSTSTTAYAGLLALAALLYGSALLTFSGRGASTAVTLAIVLAPVAALVALVASQLHPLTSEHLSAYLNFIISDKLETDSGIERMQWNRQAFTNFIDTYGIGAGLGSVRASSFPLAVLGNIGILGAITYTMFLISALVPRGAVEADKVNAARSAARWACIAGLTAATISGALIDLGLAFFAFAALAYSPEGFRYKAGSSKQTSAIDSTVASPSN